MEGLVIKPEGHLEYIRWVYDDEAEKGDYVPRNVSEQAAAYLMEPVRFEGELFLRDIFKILERNPILLEVFRRDWAAEYLAEYHRVKDTAAAYTGEYDKDGIEYLELYQVWEKNSKTGEISGHHRLDFNGTGYELRDDITQDDWVMHRKGTRISWAVEFTPLAELLNLPLRFNSDIFVTEGDLDTKRANRLLEPEKWKSSEPTLAQVIHGVIWELSFCGGPEDVAERKAEIDERISEVEEGRAILHPLETLIPSELVEVPEASPRGDHVEHTPTAD